MNALCKDIIFGFDFTTGYVKVGFFIHLFDTLAVNQLGLGIKGVS